MDCSRCIIDKLQCLGKYNRIKLFTAYLRRIRQICYDSGLSIVGRLAKYFHFDDFTAAVAPGVSIVAYL